MEEPERKQPQEPGEQEGEGKKKRVGRVKPKTNHSNPGRRGRKAARRRAR
jgi:hypothetical protein